MERWKSVQGRAGAIALRVAFILILGVLLASCGGGSNPPPSPEDAEEVIVRVSGTEGIAYSGDYSTLEGDLQDVEGTLEGEPVEYTVQIESGVADGVTAFFRKTEPGPGELKAQILADGELVVESTTYAELGSVIIDWLPEVEISDEELMEGDLPAEVPPEESP